MVFWDFILKIVVFLFISIGCLIFFLKFGGFFKIELINMGVLDDGMELLVFEVFILGFVLVLYFLRRCILLCSLI